MANLGSSITYASDIQRKVLSAETAGTGGVAVGDVVYRSSGVWVKAQSNASTTIGSTGILTGDIGVALNTAAVGQPCDVLIYGKLESGSGYLPGQVYCVSDSAAGEIVAHSALTEDTDYVVLVGVALTATTIFIMPMSTGVVLNLV